MLWCPKWHTVVCMKLFDTWGTFGGMQHWSLAHPLLLPSLSSSVFTPPTQGGSKQAALQAHPSDLAKSLSPQTWERKAWFFFSGLSFLWVLCSSTNGRQQSWARPGGRTPAPQPCCVPHCGVGSAARVGTCFMPNWANSWARPIWSAIASI